MATPDTIGSALIYGAVQLTGLPTARRHAELLLMRVLGCDRTYLLTHPEMQLTAEQSAVYDAWLTRRARHEPVQYIVGEQEFFGLKFRVTPDVLIPRPETEHLVEAALARAGRESALHIADVGTGSGAIAVALAHALPRARVTALDISATALAVAQKNAKSHGVSDRIRFLQSDLLTAVAGERFDIIASNPPYVAEGEELESQVRDYEPAFALFAGPEGLDIYRRLIPQAQDALRPGGWLLLEIGHGQRGAVAQLLAGWGNVSFVTDLQGIPRVACAQRTE
jgi:release factor glutamine methyltransferase